MIHEKSSTTKRLTPPITQGRTFAGTLGQTTRTASKLQPISAIFAVMFIAGAFQPKDSVAGRICFDERPGQSSQRPIYRRANRIRTPVTVTLDVTSVDLDQLYVSRAGRAAVGADVSARSYGWVRWAIVAPLVGFVGVELPRVGRRGPPTSCPVSARREPFDANVAVRSR